MNCIYLFSSFQKLEAFFVLVCCLGRNGCFQEILDGRLPDCCFFTCPEVKLTMAVHFQSLDWHVYLGKSFKKELRSFPHEVSKNMEGVDYQSGLREHNMSEVTVDRISSLPWNVLDIILGKLSLYDAVRTSVLATEWRYKWLSLSKFFLYSHFIVDTSAYKSVGWDVVSNIINRYLLHHRFHHRLHRDGGIRTFVLRTYCSAHYPELYQWIQYLSKLDVEIMSLAEVGYLFFVVPSYLFLFEKLQSLNLEMCAIKIPSSFRRFSFLRELSLRNVSISDDDLHHLILACPLLEKLALFRINELKHLNINSPRLFELQIDLGMEDIVIGDPTRLDSVHIIEYSVPQIINYNWRSVIFCFSSMVVLRKLDLCGEFIEILAADCEFENFPWSNNSLSRLCLTYLNSKILGTFRVCLSLLRSCPNIKKLKLLFDPAEGPRLITKFLKENKGRVSFPALDSIVVRCSFDAAMGCNVNFIEFLCAHSPNLRSLRIVGWPVWKKAQIPKLLKRFKKVCPRALIIITCGYNRV